MVYTPVVVDIFINRIASFESIFRLRVIVIHLHRRSVRTIDDITIGIACYGTSRPFSLSLVEMVIAVSIYSFIA